MPQGFIHGGLSGVVLNSDRFDLGEGIELERTFAHVFAHPMVAFAPPGLGGYHPAPWKATRGGGFTFDVTAELKVPSDFALAKDFDARDVVWWIAAMLRLVRVPFLSVPVLSNQSFSAIADSEEEPHLQSFEIRPRIFGSPEGAPTALDVGTIEWVRSVWLSSGKLAANNARLRSAIEAFDQATVRGRPSSSLLALWGGLEQLFAPSPGELRYRVSSLLASYLEPAGDKRLELYRRILKLYNSRSQAAHTAAEAETGIVVETYVLMRNALVKIIDQGIVPTQQDLELLLFCPEPPSCS